MVNNRNSKNSSRGFSNAFGEYDQETMDRVHRENIRKSKLALEQSASPENDEKSTESISDLKKYTWKSFQPRKVLDSEISPYQGFGGKKQMQRAQSRKRTQVRRREASIWNNIAPKEVHGILNFMLWAIFLLALALVTVINW